MHQGYRTSATDKARVRINREIRARELRVIGPEGENLGVLSLAEALARAEEAGLDLIEISEHANPPIAKVTDYGKFQYEAKRKKRESARGEKVKKAERATEVKITRVKVGTAEGDLQRKANEVGEWIEEGYSVKVDLFLHGRYKYMEEGFLKERLERFMRLIPADYKIVSDITRSPRGFSATIIADKAGKKQDSAQEQKNGEPKRESNE